MICNPPENIRQVDLGIETVQLGRRGDGVETGRALAAGIGAAEEVILSPQNWDAHRALGGIVACALSRRTILPGGNPGRQTLAPAGSTRGGSGGDEWSEALREKYLLIPLCSERRVGLENCGLT